MDATFREEDLKPTLLLIGLQSFIVCINHFPIFECDNLSVLDTIAGNGLFEGARWGCTWGLNSKEGPEFTFQCLRDVFTAEAVERYRSYFYKQSESCTCSHCRKVLSFEEFDGSNTACKRCRRVMRANAQIAGGRIRDARLAMSIERHTDEEWAVLLEACGGRCLRCGTASNLSRDHVMPVSKGGDDGIANIQPLCRSCNSWKHDRHIEYRDPLVIKTFATKNVLVYTQS